MTCQNIEIRRFIAGRVFDVPSISARSIWERSTCHVSAIYVNLGQVAAMSSRLTSLSWALFVDASFGATV